MTVSIILATVFIILGITMSYAYIRLTVAKEKENELLKRKIQKDLDSKKDELNHYKTAIKIIEKYTNKPEDKRFGCDDLDDKVIGILGRCGFLINTINDNEEFKDKKELKFKLNGKDLISVINKTVTEQDRAQV